MALQCLVIRQSFFINVITITMLNQKEVFTMTIPNWELIGNCLLDRFICLTKMPDCHC